MTPRLVFNLQPHLTRPFGQVVELWYDGVFVAEVTAGEDGTPALRVISKHGLDVALDHTPGRPLEVVTVTVRL